MSRTPHLSDDRLAECYFNERCAEAPDLASLEHLADCPSCADRYGQVSTMLTEVREVAESESDAVFTADRLASQRHQILARLEAVHRAPRVLSFPARETPVEPRPAAGLTTRWIAGAAAAGLFIGFAVGEYAGPARVRTVTSTTAAAPPMSVERSANPPAVVVGTTLPETTDDDQFLRELDLALTRSYARELQPFDALTPHVRE